MPHGNGRIYKDSSTTPPGGISIADIQAVIVSGKNDIKSLALSSKINPDALFKPYECDGGPENPNFATGGPDGMYGYSIPNTTGHLMDIYNKLWTFNPPVSFGRFDDFDCYNHVPRFSSNPWGLSVTETPSTLYCSFQWGGPAEYVCPRNMALFADCYPAVAIFATGANGDWELRYAVASNTKIGVTNGALIQVVKSGIDLTPGVVGGTVVLVPFISAIYFTETTDIQDLNMRKWNWNYQANQCYFLEGTEPQVAPYTINVTRAATRAASNVIRISGTVTNNTDTAQNVVFYPLFRFYDALEGTGNILFDAMEYTTGVNPLFSQTVQAGATVSWEFFLTNGDGSSLADVLSLLVQMHSPVTSTADTTAITINIS